DADYHNIEERDHVVHSRTDPRVCASRVTLSASSLVLSWICTCRSGNPGAIQRRTPQMRLVAPCGGPAWMRSVFHLMACSWKPLMLCPIPSLLLPSSPHPKTNGRSSHF